MPVLRHSTAARNAAASAVVGLLDAGPAAGRIEIRSGTMPATPQTAATGTLLATVTLADPAAGASNSTPCPATSSPTPTPPRTSRASRCPKARGTPR